MKVVAIIAGVAASEVEGIAGMCNVSGNLLGKNRAVTKGVKVEIGTEEASVDLYVIMEYGTPIQKAAYDAQESVRKAIETMTNLHVVRVDVHVQGVSFEKENNALNAGARRRWQRTRRKRRWWKPLRARKKRWKIPRKCLKKRARRTDASYCRQGVCLAGFEVAIQCKSENGKRRKRKERTGNEASCERYCG